MDRQFPPLGVKLVASNDRNLKVIVKLRRPIAQISPVFRPLSEVEALAAVVKALPENPHGTGVFPRPHHLRRRGCAPRVPLPSGGNRGAQKGGKWRERPPFLPFKVRHRAGMTIAHQIAHFSSPFRAGGRSLHSDPCGKAVESAKKPTAKNSRPQMALRPRRGKPGGCTQPNMSDPQHGQFATPLDGLGLRVDTRLTCPPISWRVQWVPFQKEGYNEGTAAG